MKNISDKEQRKGSWELRYNIVGNEIFHSKEKTVRYRFRIFPAINFSKRPQKKVQFSYHYSMHNYLVEMWPQKGDEWAQNSFIFKVYRKCMDAKSSQMKHLVAKQLWK